MKKIEKDEAKLVIGKGSRATQAARLLREAKKLEQAGASEAAETLRRAADQTASQESQK